MVKSFYSVLLKKCIVQGQKIDVFLALMHLLSEGCHWVMKWGRMLSRRRVRISQPVSVTSSVCSNCAERFPSLVTAVQPSGHVSSCQPPANRNHASCQLLTNSSPPKGNEKSLQSALQDTTSILFHHYLRANKSNYLTLLLNCSPSQIIGSMVNTWPGFMTPTALFSAIK